MQGADSYTPLTKPYTGSFFDSSSLHRSFFFPPSHLFYGVSLLKREHNNNNIKTARGKQMGSGLRSLDEQVREDKSSRPGENYSLFRVHKFLIPSRQWINLFNKLNDGLYTSLSGKITGSPRVQF